MPPTAQEFFREKAQLVTELRTRELSRLPLEVRERSFFMAAVSRAEILQIFRDASDDFLSGKEGRARAREIVREKLAMLGYTPEAGEAGTIKDLSSLARVNLVLDTNADMARNHANYQKRLLARWAFPGQRMVRLAHRQKRRPWPALFSAALEKLPAEERAGANATSLAARIDHPVWVKLSRFGTPYTPFDFNSGMGLRAVGVKEARDLGIHPRARRDGETERQREGEELVPPADPSLPIAPSPSPSVSQSPRPAVPPSLNASLEATPRVADEGLRKELAETLQGFAKWEGDVLKFTDPNGTRPLSAAAAAEVIAAPLPAGFPHLQQRAALAWADEPMALARGLDLTADFRRLVQRVTDTKPEAEALHTALSLPDAAAVARAEKVLLRDAFRLREIFTGFDEGAARAALRVIDGERTTGAIIVLELLGPSEVKDLRPLYEALGRPDVPAVIALQTQRFRAVAVREETGPRGELLQIVTIEEIF